MSAIAEFTGITKDHCWPAWDLIQLIIRDAAKKKFINKLAGTIVVLEPRIPYTGQPIQDLPILFKAGIAYDDPEAVIKYDEIAIDKAYITWKTGLPSAVVQQRYPYLYQNGDTKWGGSTITEGGLIVAFSGVEAFGDEWISELMASTVTFFCRRGMLHKEIGVMAFPDQGFIGR